MRNLKRACLLALLSLACGGFSPAGAATLPHAATLGQFNIAREPSRPDWRYFIRAPEAAREQLWTYQVKHGRHLGEWSWGWRLGWVRVCGRSDRPYCAAVLREALFDKALVVRAEAATRFGRLFEHTGNPQVVDLLAKAFRNSRNLRHGKPLYVQSRILFAMRQVGGEHALATGQALAASQPQAAAYWQKLAKIGRLP